MRVFEYIRERLAERQRKKYYLALLTCKLRLRNVPRWLLRDPPNCHALYFAAFRVARGTSKEQYLEDMSFLEVEILLAQIAEDRTLENKLLYIQEYATLGLEYFNPLEV